MAQLGSALDWGSRGRRFKSCQPDRRTAPDLRKRGSGAVPYFEPAKTLQIRLNEDELAELVALASDRGLPVSTVARQLLLQSLAPADDLKSALDRLERDVSAVRRKALSA